MRPAVPATYHRGVNVGGHAGAHAGAVTAVRILATAGGPIAAGLATGAAAA